MMLTQDQLASSKLRWCVDFTITACHLPSCCTIQLNFPCLQQLMQVTLPSVSLTFHKVSITSRSFLEAVTEEALLHFPSDSPFSERGLESQPWKSWHLLYIILVVVFLIMKNPNYTVKCCRQPPLTYHLEVSNPM